MLMEATVRAGPSRQVAAAVASALLRTASEDVSARVAVPEVVADDVPVVAAALAAQKVAGQITGEEHHNLGTAVAALRRVVPKDLVRDLHALRKERHAVVHRGSALWPPSVC